MTADDVAYSFRRVMDPATASSGAWVFNGKVDPETGFTALNDSTFRLRLLQPFQPIMGILSMQYCSVVPKEVVAHYGKDFRKNPIGTGPFKFFYWDEGQALVLHKTPLPRIRRTRQPPPLPGRGPDIVCGQQGHGVPAVPSGTIKLHQ